MLDLEQKDYLVQSFHGVVSDVKDALDKMTSDQSYLNVFLDKDITGTDMPNDQLASMSETLIMHLYMNSLKKDEDWDSPKFPETVYTNMYTSIVKVENPSVFLVNGNVKLDNECGNEQNENSDNNFAIEKCVDEKVWQAKLHCFFQSIFFPFYVWFLSFFKKDECESNYEECNNVVIERSLVKQDEEMKYSGIAMCEFSLIHSLDDLEASLTLLNNAHFSQSVFMSSQSVEKSLKSILSSYQSSFPQFIHLHSATALFKRLRESSVDNPNHPFSRYLYQFEDLCYYFEMIGEESWTRPKPLSIRSRYFNYQNSTYHYYVDSYPGIVFSSDHATEAYYIAAEMFELCDVIFTEVLNNFEAEM